MNLPPARTLPVIVYPSSEDERSVVEANRSMVCSLGRIDKLQVKEHGSAVAPPRMSATAVVGEMRIFVPLEGIVDPDAEVARLEKELAKIEKEFAAVEKKLSNEAFLSKANAEAIQKQKDKQADLSAKRSGLGESLGKMRKLKTD